METAGSQTTEYKVLKWLGIVSGVVVAILTGLSAAGLFPAEGTAAAAVAAVLAVAHALSGYAKSRGDVKSSLIYEQGRALEKATVPVNPTPAP